MDSDQGKLFIGGISWETTDEKLIEHFSQYGKVVQTAVMKDKTTGRPRGFGFVVFSEPSVLDIVLQEKHTIDGRTVEAKRALSREEQQTNTRSGSTNMGRSTGVVRTKKIFVGGLPSSLTEDEFRQYFATFGNVEDAVIMYDQNTQRPRGFGFISFDAEDAVDRVLHKAYHDLNGKKVEVKRALPKDANIGGGNRNSNAGIGGYQSYGSSGGNDHSFDGQMDSTRYMQAPGSGAGFPPYGSSGYAAPGYGYGANSGMGYAGYGSYSGPGGAAYGNPNVPSSGYPGPQSGARGAWSSQAPSAYGAMGYGSSAPWGATAAGTGAGGVGPGSGPSSGQSPGGVAGYGNQGYGYGGYMGADGGYGAVGGRYGSSPNTGARGASGGEIQGNTGGYAAGGYGDANGNPGNAGWRADPPHASGNYGNTANGPHGAYGGGYNGVQARQAQQQ